MSPSKIGQKSSRSRTKGKSDGKAKNESSKAAPVSRSDRKIHQRYGALAAFLLPLAAYVFFLCPTIAAGDSGELITASKVLGIPHPPGYPLFTMIGHLFTWIPFQSVAWRVNLSSALFSSLACLFVYLSLLRLTGRVWPALTGALGLAFSRYFWHYAEVAEVFPLNGFFVALLTYLLVLLVQNAERLSNAEDKSMKQQRLFWLCAFFFGLALTNHHTIVLLAPGALVLLWWATPQLFKNGKSLGLAALFFVVGLTPYVYSPLAAAAQPLINWDNPITWNNFANLITRADYGSLSLLPEESQANVAVSRISQLPAFFAGLLHQFTFLGLALALLGLISYRRFKLFNSYVALGFFFSGIFFVLLANMPITNPLLLGVLHRFYIMPAIFFAYWIGLGANQVLLWIQTTQEAKFFRLGLPILILGSLTSWQFASNVEEADFRNNYVAEDFARNILDSLPERSLFFVRGDVASMGVDYLQMVEGERPDVMTLDQAKLTYPWYYKQMQRRYPEIVLPGKRYDGLETRNVHFISKNLDKFPVCFMDFKEESYSQTFRASPVGMVYQMAPKSESFPPEKLEQEVTQFLSNFQVRGLEEDYPPTSFEYEVKQIYAEPFFRLGYEFEQAGRFKKAVTYYEKAMQMNPVHFRVMKNLGVVLYYKLNQKARAVMLFRRYLELNPGDPEGQSIQQIVRMHERSIRPTF
jgi:tetratricopeptide (TPR) repeat protein